MGNEHIRCIEISLSYELQDDAWSGNEHIRCIEIVLKHCQVISGKGATNTLDVLKWQHVFQTLPGYQGNEHIRCIEICHHHRQHHAY